MIHPTVVPTNFVQTDKQIADIIGREYLLADFVYTDELNEAMELYVGINDILWGKMQEEIKVVTTEDDPYSSYEEMKDDIDEFDQMYVFSGGTHPEYLVDDENAEGSFDQNRYANIIARAVHDYWGHYKNDCDFSFWGEFQKWHHQKRYYPEVCHPYLFTEVVGQTALAHHLPDGFDDVLYQQKIIKAPQRWIDLCYKHCPVKLE